MGPHFNQVNLVVREMTASVAFYRLLGVDVAVDDAAAHASIELGPEIRIELDATDFVPNWDSGFSGATGGSTVIGFRFPTREAVDETHDRLTAAGYRSHQYPYDAFFGARYAIVDDPDGNPIGLMSPIDGDLKVWPPPALRPASTA